MIEHSYFETKLLDEGYSPTYRSFLTTFINSVESLSMFGAHVWENLFEEVDIYLPSTTNPAFLIEWYDRRKLPDHRFRLQCAYLHKQGVYKDYELERHWYFPQDPGWRKGENQTAEVLSICKGNSEQIAALFIYALLKSGNRHEVGRHEKYIFEETHERRRSPKTGRLTLLEFETKTRPLSVLENVLSEHLVSCDIWHYWASTCTSLLPIINDSNGWQKVFTYHDEFAMYLAEQFVLMSSKLAVCTYNIVPNEDKILMSRIRHFVNKNRVEHEQREQQWKLQQKELEKEKMEQDKASADEYKELCKGVLTYTEQVPAIFEKYTPLKAYWRELDSKSLETLIWSAPFTLLSKMFKKSDNGLRKWVREHGILLPKAGYWAKVKASKVEYPNGSPNKQYAIK